MKKHFITLSLSIASLLLLCSCSALNDEITMEFDSGHYEGYEWSHSDLAAHFRDMGFENIEEVGSSYADQDEYNYDVLEVVIERGPFNTDRWEAGESFSPDSSITIYYNEEPALTVDNCPELAAILSGEDTSFLDFAEKHDGRYVDFQAYVVQHLTYNSGLDHVIDVTGRSDFASVEIRVDGEWLADNYNENVEVGQKVRAVGTIDKDRSLYYKHLYVSCFILAPLP